MEAKRAIGSTSFDLFIKIQKWLQGIWWTKNKVDLTVLH